ncbi:hypothetical protein Pan97_13700 [Bremerella volcania]|uniref:Bacterial type II/III secretion system short domain protein n=1 Tax=Bremerella volcania TaxID=2527984 RepID=A0A518C553_9BACT|nr:hypothetical protein [Bremerella volcania]QDU74363.1 hypothetical protein Pan97_13700 [Bremerella volcania]
MSPTPSFAQSPYRSVLIACLLGFLPWGAAMAQFGPAFQIEANPLDSPQPPALVPPRSESLEYQQVDAIEKRVQAARLGLQVVDMPLDQVAQIFTQRTGIPMRIDERALEDVGLSTDTPVTFNLPEVAAETLLYLMLKELDLVFVMDTGSVIITTPEEEESSLRTRFYAAEDIFNDPNPNYDFLIQMLTTCMDPESWEELGGPGSIAQLRNGVIISQTYQNHRHIQGLFAALRRVQKSPRQGDLPVMMSVSPYAQQEAQVARRLRQVRTTITLTDAPLGSSIAAMSNFSRIPMFIDNRALEDVGLSNDVPVTMQLSDANIDYMLDVMLERLELTTMILGEVVIVTTPEEAESELKTFLYPVKDLVRYDSITGRELTKRGVTGEFDRLIDAITTTVEPESWEELGGPGSLAPFPYADCLVVSQIGDVHRKVAELLEQVRKAQPKVSPAEPQASYQPLTPAPISRPENAPEPAAGESIIVVSYTPEKSRAGEFSREKFARIAERLKQVVAPQSWAGEEYFADATHNGVFVRQSRDVQRTVASYLASQGLIAPPIEEEESQPQPMPASGQPLQAPGENPPTVDSTAGGSGIF